MLFYGYCSFTRATADCDQSGGRSELKEIQTEVKGYSEGTMFISVHRLSLTIFCLHFGSTNRSKQNMIKHAQFNYRITSKNHGKSWLTVT